MASRLLLAEKRAAIDSIATLAQRDLVELWRSLDLSGDPTAITAALLDDVPAITDTYGAISADVAADFYDDVRAEARIRSRFTATPASVAPAEQVSAFVRWAVTPMWSSAPDPITTLGNLSGGVTRLSLNPGRDTVTEAAQKDPARPRIARATEAKACSFCLALASRGAVYSYHFKAHDDCKCDPVPVHESQDPPEENQRLAAEWREVTAGATSPKDARSRWRAHTGAR